MTAGRVKAGVFSMAERSPTGDDAAYLEWHQLDHQPEQYQLDGLLDGQRWASTDACHAARAVESDPFAAVVHVTQYLMGDPVDATIDEFLDLGARLAGLGRYPHRLPSVLLANFDLVATVAAPRVRVSPQVVPFRPNLGVYLVLDEPGEPDRHDADRRRWLLDEHLHQLVEVDGVAGAWMFAPGSRRPDRFDARGLDITICYLDDDPVEVARRLAEPMRDRFSRWRTTPRLAAPFETVRPWQWARFAPSG
jgi:hypothetical protein